MKPKPKRPLRILLATNACYMPSRGGSTRSNRAWLERLASRGHHCEVVAPRALVDSEYKEQYYRKDCEAQGTHIEQHIAQTSKWNGVALFNASHPQDTVELLKKRASRADLDFILVSSEDFGQALLRVAVSNKKEKTIYLAHTPQMFPFGPASLAPSSVGVKALAETREIICISQYVCRYFDQHLNRVPHIIHPPVYGAGPFAHYGENSKGFITIINPCKVKGVSLFLEIVRARPHFNYAALPGWGTTSDDLRDLRKHEITVLEPCREIDTVLSRTRVLLTPSLWPEGFGLVVVEAMLRGIPVLSSDAGGLPEAKLGTEYTFSVKQICSYSSKLDEHYLPIPELPEQDCSPWCAALDILLKDKQAYLAASAKASKAAARFVNNLFPDQLEAILMELRS